jgi:hypothetical protein
MRFSELLENDYNEDLRSEVITLLTAVSAEGISEISTQNLLNDLEQQGFAVDAESLLLLLADMDIVSKATDEEITISTTDADYMVGAQTDDVKSDRVDNMAATQATKDLGEDEAYDPSAQYKEMGDAKLMSLKSYGLGKQRDFARDEIARRAESGAKWQWSEDNSGEVDSNYGIEFDESLTRMRKLAGLTEDQSVNYLTIAKQLKQQIENSGRSFQTQINQHLIDDLQDAKVTDVESAVEWYEGWIADGEYGLGHPDLEIIIAYNGYDYDVTAPGAEYSDMTELGHFDFDQAKLAAREARARLQDEGHKVKITLRK